MDAELVMHKPNLTTLTGGYRKTPVMQIGADIYCDSRLIALERFPTPTLFPGDRSPITTQESHAIERYSKANGRQGGPTDALKLSEGDKITETVGGS